MLTEHEYEIEFQCPCGASMRGRPRLNETWSCAKNHTFKVLRNAIDIAAWAMIGNAGGKVRKGAIYRWNGKLPFPANTSQQVQSYGIGGNYQMEPMEIVKCFNCNGELSTTWSELKSGRRAKCRSCRQDLTPRHHDPECGLCKGQGAFRVNGAIWICAHGYNNDVQQESAETAG